MHICNDRAYSNSLSISHGRFYAYVWFPESTKENDFHAFGCIKEYMKENQIWLKLVRNLCIFKSFNLYIEELKQVK